MRNIHSKNTTPELLIMKELKRRKIYFAKHADKIIGKPDIVFRRKRIVVFIDSDFWHYNPKLFIMPKSNVKYWKSKIKNNIERDKYVNKEWLFREYSGKQEKMINSQDGKYRFNKSFL